MDMSKNDQIFIREDQPTGIFCPAKTMGKGKATLYSIPDGSNVERGEFDLVEDVQVDGQFTYVLNGECDRRDIQMALDMADGNLIDYEIITFGDMMEAICPTDEPDGP